jgi:hypothetical protein
MSVPASSHQFTTLYTELGININQLGCVMLPVEPFDLFGEGRSDLLSQDDLYVSNHPDKFWIKGDVSDRAHITLLYGLMTPAYEQKESIDTVMAGWDRPEYLIPDWVTIFPSRDEEEPGYAAIVAEVQDEHLIEANQRLSYLPHISTFPEYRAHMTLAYVKMEQAMKWKDVLNLATFHIYTKEELDYGSEK